MGLEGAALAAAITGALALIDRGMAAAQAGYELLKKHNDGVPITEEDLKAGQARTAELMAVSDSLRSTSRQP